MAVSWDKAELQLTCLAISKDAGIVSTEGILKQTASNITEYFTLPW